MKFGTAMHIRPPDMTVNQKFQNFKIQDGGRQPSGKSNNHDMSETVWPILTKFCTMAHINPPEVTS